MSNSKSWWPCTTSQMCSVHLMIALVDGPRPHSPVPQARLSPQTCARCPSSRTTLKDLPRDLRAPQMSLDAAPLRLLKGHTTGEEPSAPHPFPAGLEGSRGSGGTQKRAQGCGLTSGAVLLFDGRLVGRRASRR